MNRDMYAVGKGEQSSPFPFCMKEKRLHLTSQLFPRKHIKMVGSTLLLGNIVKLTPDWH